tara:strand:- start:537 stop:1583 length:1047 start_codon:yes stop_codon:yes gene_type:complete
MNLMIGTSIEGQGGIASVLQQYRQYGLLEKWDFKLIVSHKEKVNIVLSILIFVKCIILLFFYFLRYNVGFVHIHMASNGSYKRKALLVRLIKFLGAKAIIHLHGGGFKLFYELSPIEKKRHILNTFLKADKTIVLSKSWYEWLVDVLGDSSKVSIVYNATEQICDNPDPISGHILFLGRLEEAKGVSDLIYAFSNLTFVYPHITLTLGGTGNFDFYKSLAAQLGVQDKVTFAGWVSGGDKQLIFRTADIYCLPSYKEGFPMGVIEAMSSHLAVIASDVGGIPDAIEHNTTGLLFKAGKREQLEQNLESYLSNEKLKNSIKIKAFEKFNDEFSFDVVIPSLEKIYNEII